MLVVCEGESWIIKKDESFAEIQKVLPMNNEAGAGDLLKRWGQRDGSLSRADGLSSLEETNTGDDDSEVERVTLKACVTVKRVDDDGVSEEPTASQRKSVGETEIEPE